MSLVNEIQIVDAIKRVYDPEIPVNIYDLGLIYSIEIEQDDNSEGAIVKVLMTLTAPNCPEAEVLPEQVKEEILMLEGVSEAEVEITFEPPWSQDRMSEEAKFALDMIY